MPAALGPLETVAGWERVYATMLDLLVTWRIEGANSAMKERWRCWRAETGSDPQCRVPTSSLWSVKTTKLRPFSINQKWLMAATTARSERVKAL